jgi:hypothetical protein
MRVDTVERRLEGYALLQKPVRDLVVCFTRDLHWQQVKHTENPDEAIRFLSEFTFPATRHVLFSAVEDWSVLLDNTPSADVDRVPFMANQLKTRAIRVVNSPERRWQKEGLPDFYISFEARIVQYSDKSVDIPLSIYLCVDRGSKAEFQILKQDHCDIDPLNFTAPNKARIRERFSFQQLSSLVEALGSRAVTAENFLSAKNYYLFADPHTKTTPKGTPEDRDNPAWHYFQSGVQWSQPSHRHANWYDSVISAMEKAIVYDPSLHDKAQRYLEPAYRAKKNNEA